MGTYLSEEQVAVLLRPIKPGRVSKDRDGMSHLQAYDVRAHLNRVFGFGRWSADLLEITQLYEHPTETKAGKPGFSVAYRATVRLTVCAPDGTTLATYTECATGGNVMPDFKRADSHDFAIKTAESQALKRCATNLGDQFGLSLYAQGATDAVVRQTLVGSGDGSGEVEPEHVTPEDDGAGQMHPVAAVNGVTGEIVQAEVARSSQPGQFVDVTDPANQAFAQQLGDQQERKATRSKGRDETDVRWETLPLDEALEELRAQVREAAAGVGMAADQVPGEFDTRYPDIGWENADADGLAHFVKDLRDEHAAMGA